MLVYRDAAGMPVAAEGFLAELLAKARGLASLGTPSYDAAVSFAVDLGMFEAAVADERDADERAEPVTRALRQASIAAACATLAARDSALGEMRRSAARAADALCAVHAATLPRTLCLRVPEGFAYYGLFPDLYADAAARGVRGHPGARAVCIGIRSIGTTLSAFVTAALEARGVFVKSWTLRPRGHPFDRRARLGASLAGELLTPLPDVVLVADEGPGLSGSSFAAAVDALRTARVPADRIVLLPAWDPDASTLASSRAADIWQTYRKLSVTFEESWIRSGRLERAVGARSLEDISAGGWRRVWRIEGEEPAIQPQHERRKYLAPQDVSADHRLRLVKFAGLGRFGDHLAARAEALRDLPVAGGCVPLRLVSGFLASDVTPGRPMTARDAGAGFLEVAAMYLAQVAVRFRLDVPADRDALVHMLEVNARELFPDAPLTRLGALAREATSFAPAPAIDLDARMHPHEWLRTNSGYLKTDALEHHDDHFFPGAQDVAWDVAGTIEEFALDEPAAAAFATAVAAPLHDRTLHARLAFHRAAYCAFRAAYCAVGAKTLSGSPEGDRLARSAEGYRDRLAALIG